MPKPASKASSNSELLGFDLLYVLCYLSAVAAAGVPRSEIFKVAATLPTSATPYFHEVDRTAQGMNYDYAEACRIVGEGSRQGDIKSLFLRLSGSLASGEQVSDFMAREASLQAEAHSNAYEGKLEALRKWTDAFAALTVSATLVIVVAAISTVIYDLGSGFVTGLVGVMVAISSLGVWMIYRSGPKEMRTLTGNLGKPSQARIHSLAMVLLPCSLAAAAVMQAIGLPLGPTVIGAAVLMLPVGIAANRYDAAVTRFDRDVGTFIRVLGFTASAIGTTPTEAISRIDMRSMDSLAPLVKRLQTALKARVAPGVAWRRFVTDTGSELVHRAVRIFNDGISFGGDAAVVGERAAILATSLTYLRTKRQLVANPFGWLTLVMHGTVTFLLLFVVEIVARFGVLLQGVGAESPDSSTIAVPDLLSFSFANMHYLQAITGPVAIGLSFISAAAANLAGGSYLHRVFLFLPLTLAAAGAAMLLAPPVTGMLFNLTG